MPISTVIGMLAAIIGTTATLLAAWGYIHSKRPAKREVLGALLVIILIMTGLLSVAVMISRLTTISVNGQQTIPVPGFPPPGKPVPASTSTSTRTPTPTLTPTPTSSPSPTATPILTPTPVPSPSAIPSPTPKLTR
jgi:cytoskeletal protein RodZ